MKININATIITIYQGIDALTIAIASCEKINNIAMVNANNALIPFASPKGFLKVNTAYTAVKINKITNIIENWSIKDMSNNDAIFYLFL